MSDPASEDDSQNSLNRQTEYKKRQSFDMLRNQLLYDQMSQNPRIGPQADYPNRKGMVFSSMLSQNADTGFASHHPAKFDKDIIRTSKSLNKVGMGASRSSVARNYSKMGMGTSGLTKSQQLNKMPRRQN